MTAILVTRPEGQADGLLAAIEAAGYRAYHYPVMAIQELEDAQHQQACKQQILALDEYQQVIFVSTNAVRFGMAWIDQYWPQLPLGIAWYGIGSATVQALQDADVPVDVPVNSVAADSPMNSEALLQHPQLQQLADQRVLIVRGVGGRDYLQQQLEQRGASVSYAECYQRAVNSRPVGEVAGLIERQQLALICVNSNESLDCLCQLAGSKALLQDRQLVVPGPRVAAYARQQGFVHVAEARNASDNAMLATCQELIAARF